MTSPLPRPRKLSMRRGGGGELTNSTMMYHHQLTFTASPELADMACVVCSSPHLFSAINQ